MLHSTLLRPGRAGVLILALLGFGRQAAAQIPTWQGAVALGTSAGNRSIVAAIATDASGNVYLTGDFRGTIQLGTLTLTEPTGASRVFVAKWNTAGQRFEWAKLTGGSTAFSIAVQGTGIYVAGGFTGQNASFGTTTLSSAGMGDVFVAKLTDAGDFVWAQRAGGQYDDSAVSLAADGTNVFVGGFFSGSTAAFGTTTLTNTGGGFTTDLFVAKLTDAGSFVWAVPGGGVNDDYVQAVAVNGPNVYVAGQFRSPTATLSSLRLTNYSYDGLADVLVAKLVDEGSSARFVWAHQAGGSGNDYARTLAINENRIYVAGGFTGTGARFGTTTLNSAGATDAFVCKLQDLGTFTVIDWARRAGGTRNDEVLKMAVNGLWVYLAGSFASPTATFGLTTLTKAGPANDSSDVFVARLQETGSQPSFNWAQRAGGTGNDAAVGLALQNSTVYTSGYATPAATFGPATLPKQPGEYVGFLAALPDNAITATHRPAPLPGLSIYPNPAHGSVLVEVPALAGAAPATLTLTDALGRTVRSYSASPVAGRLRHELALQGLAPGFYTLRVAVNGQSATCPLAVE